MKELLIKIHKSKTIWFSYALLVFGLIQQYLPMVQDDLDHYYGWIFMGVSVAVAILRTVTTVPLNQK